MLPMTPKHMMTMQNTMDVFRMYAGICGVPSLDEPLPCMLSKRPLVVMLPPAPPLVYPSGGAKEEDVAATGAVSLNWTT